MARREAIALITPGDHAEKTALPPSVSARLPVRGWCSINRTTIVPTTPNLTPLVAHLPSIVTTGGDGDTSPAERYSQCVQLRPSADGPTHSLVFKERTENS